MAKATCQICKVKDDTSNMIKEVNKKYYHNGECHDKYNEEIQFRRVELEKWDQLYKFLLELHGAVTIPVANVVRLQALRNGEDIVAGERVRKYKQGADYLLMLDAYKLAEDSIRWCIANKLNRNNDAKAINYCISIMLGKLNEAWVRQKNKKKQEESLKIKKENEYIVNADRTTTYKNNDNDDISFLLD